MQFYIKMSLFLGLMIFTLTPSFAQKKAITGRVIDSGGNPIFGVRVYSKDEPTIGTSTDKDGNYKIKIDQYNILTFSTLGFEEKEVLIISQVELDITLKDAELDEIVVTAVAIEKQEKEIGFTYETIKSPILEEVRETNVINSLSGRIPGLNVSSSGGSLGGSSYVNIRGATSISGSNQPLFVVDGIPIDNSNVESLSRFAAPDFGNRGQDLNSDDINTITVLKGPAAAVLYGSRAANGAIIITTKKGVAGSKVSVSLNSSYTIQEIIKLPDFQNTYGQGLNGKIDPNRQSNWGVKLDGRTYKDHNGIEQKYVAQPDNVKNFFEKGGSLINNVTVQGGLKKSGYRVGITDTHQTGIVPNNSLSKQVVSASIYSKLSEKVSSSVGFNYVLNNSIGRPLQGLNNEDILLRNVYFFPRNLKTESIEQYKYESGRQNKLLGRLQNPYWTTYQNEYSSKLTRVFGYTHFAYHPLEWLELSWRLGVDSYSDNRRQITAKYSASTPKGAFWQDRIQSKQINSDMISTFTKSISDKIRFKGLLGFNINEYASNNLFNHSFDLSTPELYNVSNASINTTGESESLSRIIGGYFDFGFSYNDYLFVNLTGRNDWNSTLPKDNRSFFYPALSASFVFSEALKIESKFLSFGKIKANIAQAGNGTKPYQIHETYKPQLKILHNYGITNSYPWGPTNIIANGIDKFKAAGNDLKPEIITSWEIGTDLRLFNGFIRLDFAYYNSVINDQIIRLAVANSTGYKQELLNSGSIQNRGIEVMVDGQIIVPKDRGFGWMASFNFAKNNNKFMSLKNNSKFAIMPQSITTPYLHARVGEPVGSIIGSGWKRNENGDIIVNPTTGLGEIENDKIIANIQADFRVGFSNSFSFKGFTLSALIDWKQGGEIYSNTVYHLRKNGNVVETLNRDQPYIIKGVIDNGDGSFRPNDIPISAFDYWIGVPKEESVFDASYIKLRELSLIYTFNKDLIEKMPFRKLSIGLISRNLFILYSNAPHIDPEVSYYGSSNAQGMDIFNLPGTRSYGFNIKTTF